MIEEALHDRPELLGRSFIALMPGSLVSDVNRRQSKTLWLGSSMLGLSVAAATAIYFTRPVDPHDEGLAAGLAAFLWPFLLCPIAWLACIVCAVLDARRGLGRRALLGLLLATVAWPTVFVGYYLNQKPWLSAAEKLRDTWPDVRARGALMLGQERSRDAVPLLVGALRDPDIDVRWSAAKALAAFGADAEIAIPALVGALDDENAWVGCQAAEALGSMRGRQDRVLPPLVALLSGRTNNEWCAAQAVSKLGPDAAAAVLALVKALEHRDANVRSAACEALGSIGPQASPALRTLSNAVNDENPWVRTAAREAMTRIQARPAPAATIGGRSRTQQP